MAAAFLVGSWITSVRMAEEGLDPDLATTQNSVQAPFRDSRELAAQEIVNTLACLLRSNANFAHFSVDRGRGFSRLFLHDQ